MNRSPSSRQLKKLKLSAIRFILVAVFMLPPDIGCASSLVLIHLSDKTKYVKSLNKYDLLIIDDVGTERNAEYTLENIYWVIDERVSENH